MPDVELAAPAQPADSVPTDSVLLSVQNLRVTFESRGRSGDTIAPIEDVSFDLHDGQRLAIVGESGSGKSLTALSIMGLVRRLGGTIAPESRILLRGKDMLAMPEEELRPYRGGAIGMIFQDPLTSLNPVLKIGRQINEAIELHRPEIERSQRSALAEDLLAQVKLPRPRQLLDCYPHELSGGMRQRVMIAIALAGDPAVLVADEPTTALDVTVQAGVLDLIHELAERRRMATILITHDLSIVAGFADRVAVMYGGRVVEQADTQELYRRPRHPYTAALLASIPPLHTTPKRLAIIPGSPPEPYQRPQGCVFHPRCSYTREGRCDVVRPPLELVSDAADPAHTVACVRAGEIDLERPAGQVRVSEPEPSPPESPPSGPVILAAVNLGKTYQVGGLVTRKGSVDALRDVSLEIFTGDAFGIVGESGSGKSTLARCLLRLIEPTSGSVIFDGTDITTLSGKRLRRLRRDIQMVFQEPGSSLDPRLTVKSILSEPFIIHGADEGELRRARLVELLDLVKLPSNALERYPHEFSGGQLQRIAIARAMALRPKFLMCDEPVSALDVSVRSTVLNLLKDLQTEFSLTLGFIAHDLSLVRYLCNRVAVMQAGEVVELTTTDALFDNPRHPHTQELLLAHPVPDPERERESRRLRRQRASTG